ncbi:hypothetical protein KNT57_gp250 [Shigella phage KNP5]|uniref:hypothetical protein n=1 Tax=Shigella phage KNP5 TaxID=1871710 RepID=UPI0020019D0A|nr:hypothetical protein KNT57_gp250 [Shigella phage KNP5]
MININSKYLNRLIDSIKKHTDKQDNLSVMVTGAELLYKLNLISDTILAIKRIEKQSYHSNTETVITLDESVCKLLIKFEEAIRGNN